MVNWVNRNPLIAGIAGLVVLVVLYFGVLAPTGAPRAATPTVAPTLVVAQAAAPTVAVATNPAPSPTSPPATPTPRPPTNTSVPPTSTPVPPTPTPIPPTPTPTVLQGRAQQATEKFSLREGLAIFRLKHQGRSNFAAVLLGAPSGDRFGLLVNVIGDHDGSTALGIAKAGDYVLDISADGPWSVTIEQPVVTSAPAKPQTFTGKSAQVTPFFAVPAGLTTFKMKHNGKSNFAVIAYAANGDRRGLLVNEIGAFDGSKAVGNLSGVHLLQVSADGDWSITVE